LSAIAGISVPMVLARTRLILSVIMLSVIMLGVIVLSVIMLGVIMLCDTAPFCYCHNLPL
jgi:hypothetical protein